MPVSRESLIVKSNELMTGSNSDLELLQLSGVADSNTVFSVATIDDLPDASLNKGRFIYVESVGAYRFSDGLEWTNDYDTKPFIPLYGWGCNSNGALGDGTDICRSSPVQEVTSSANWCQVSGGYNHSLALKTSGTLWAWGVNYGKLGDGTTIRRSSPVQEVSSSTNWCQVSGGYNHSLALKTSGTLWAWGDNNNGQIGDGTFVSRISPVQEVSSSSDWCQVSANQCHSLALKTSGTLWAWGFNYDGEIGDGTVICRSSPVQEVTSSTDWCQVSGGSSHSLAFKTSGTLWAWGNNIYGQVGDGTVICRSSPVQEVTSSTDWCQVSGGGCHSLALKTNGTLWAWGRNTTFTSGGQLGDGTSIDRSSPVQEVSSSTDWCQVFGGYEHSLALKTSGTLWAWGCNYNGQIGDETLIDRSSPVQEVSSSINWCQVSAGLHSIALKYEKGFI